MNPTCELIAQEAIRTIRRYAATHNVQLKRAAPQLWEKGEERLTSSVGRGTLTDLAISQTLASAIVRRLDNKVYMRENATVNTSAFDPQVRQWLFSEEDVAVMVEHNKDDVYSVSIMYHIT